ncbi:MAG: hypothetical protein ACR2LK_00915 [Solirubrobacteraceae bacterium]
MLASPRVLARAGVTFYLGANLVTHMSQAPESIDALLAVAERAAGLLELLDGDGDGDGDGAGAGTRES